MMKFIEDTAAENPDLASIYTAGVTIEKRDIKVIVFKPKTSQSTRKIWIGIKKILNFNFQNSFNKIRKYFRLRYSRGKIDH